MVNGAIPVVVVMFAPLAGRRSIVPVAPGKDIDDMLPEMPAPKVRAYSYPPLTLYAVSPLTVIVLLTPLTTTFPAIVPDLNVNGRFVAIDNVAPEVSALSSSAS